MKYNATSSLLAGVLFPQASLRESAAIYTGWSHIEVIPISQSNNSKSDING